MKWYARAAFAALALALASCQGTGLDSGMGGGMSPPVSEPGPMGANAGGMSGNMGGNMAGPNVGLNGQEELANANPGATLAPNESQYPIAQGPSGMKCAVPLQYNQQYACTLAFNIPTPSPSGSPGASAKPSPTASPTPTPQPSASSDSDDTDDTDTPTPSPAPLGTLTMLMEPLPKDVPAMTNPDPRFMQITPLVAIRLQSNMDFTLNGGATVQYTLPSTQFANRVFALQLFNETTLRGKRMDQLIASYGKWTSPQSQTVAFAFSVPKVTVRRTQVWLLAMYGAQLPPGSTPTPSPTPSAGASPAASASAAP